MTVDAIAREVPGPDGLRFDTWSWGPPDGRVLLALHGFPQHAHSWAPLAGLLASDGVRTVSFDQRGYSPGARAALDTYRLDRFVADALAVADAYGLDAFDVAGFGMGALQGWALAGHAPARVRSLAALRFPHPGAFLYGLRTDPAQAAAWAKLDIFDPPEAAARRMLADDARGLREFLRGSGMPPDLLTRTVDRIGSLPVLTAAFAWHGVSLDDMAAVPATTVPTLFVHSAGPALTERTALRCAEWVHAPFTAVELAGAGHWLLETASDRLVAPLLQHLGEVCS